MGRCGGRRSCASDVIPREDDQPQYQFHLKVMQNECIHVHQTFFELFQFDSVHRPFDESFDNFDNFDNASNLNSTRSI